MRFDVLTLFPEIFQGYLTQSLLKLAIQKGLVEIHLWNIRDWAKGKHKSVDDRPRHHYPMDREQTAEPQLRAGGDSVDTDRGRHDGR